MSAVGRIAIEGSLGYDLSFVRVIPTATGRKIRFVTNRLLRFGETYYSTRTADYNLTAGEIDLNDQDKSKSTGILYPAAKLRLDKNNELSLDLRERRVKSVRNLTWLLHPRTRTRFRSSPALPILALSTVCLIGPTLLCFSL